jgi:chromosome partition protein MukE
MSSTAIDPPLTDQLLPVLLNPDFPALDSALRAGRHISRESVDWYTLLLDFQETLTHFYGRYQVELIQAPEGFFYLRPRSTTLIARALLSEWEMLIGKVLCYLYLSPERVNQQGLFSQQDLYQTLFSLLDQQKLLKWVNPRATGSDRDRLKVIDKVKSALYRLRRLGVVIMAKESDSFRITEVVFRFAADVRSGQDLRVAQQRLIRLGEAVIPQASCETDSANPEDSLLEDLDLSDDHEETRLSVERVPC